MQVSYPFGEIDVQAPEFAAAQEIVVENRKTIVDLGTATGNVTVTAAPADDLPAGSELIIKMKSDGTARSLTPGTGFTGTAISGTTSKTKVAAFVYDGSTFIHLSTNQID